MSFKDWFNEDDHDLYSFPDEAMEEAWNAALDLAAAKVNMLALNDEAIREAMRIITECKDN